MANSNAHVMTVCREQITKVYQLEHDGQANDTLKARNTSTCSWV